MTWLLHFLLLLEKISDLKVYTFKYNVTNLMLNISTDLFFYNLVGLPVNHLHVLTLVTKSMQLEHAEWLGKLIFTFFFFKFQWPMWNLRCDLYFIPTPSFIFKFAGPFKVNKGPLHLYLFYIFECVIFLEPPDKHASCQSYGNFYGQIRCLHFPFLFPPSL